VSLRAKWSRSISDYEQFETRLLLLRKRNIAHFQAKAFSRKIIIDSDVNSARSLNIFDVYCEWNLIKFLSSINIVAHWAAEYNAITCRQEISADCTFVVIERTNSHSDRESNRRLMDCGHKIDKLTINVIVLRGAIRRNDMAVRRIVMRLAALIQSICLSKWSIGQLSPWPGELRHLNSAWD